MRNNLFKKYEKLITDIRKASGINIVSVDEIQDNEVFSILKEIERIFDLCCNSSWFSILPVEEIKLDKWLFPI